MKWRSFLGAANNLRFVVFGKTADSHIQFSTRSGTEKRENEPWLLGTFLLVLSQKMASSKMSEAQKACQIEVNEVFDKLRSLREESLRQFSDIIDSHSSSISKRIGGLIEEVCDLRAELSVFRKEKHVLLETVDNLNGEIRQLNAKLIASNNLPKPRERLDQSIKEEDSSEVDISVEIGGDQDSPCNDGDDADTLSEEQAQADDILDEGMKLNDSHSSVYKSSKRNDKSDNNEKGNFMNTDLVCPVCNFEFSTNENLSIHLNNIHSESKQKKVTLQDLSKVKNLKNHVTGVHKKARDFLCSECDYASSYKSDLKKHKESVHGGSDKKYKCDHCPYQTHERRNLRNHIKGVHEKVRDHVCGECGYASSLKSGLKRHEETMHGKRDKKFKCDFCPYESHVKENLTRHVKKWH